MNPISTPASEWSSETLAALEKGQAAVDDTTGLSKLSGREQAAAQLAARMRAAEGEQTVDQQLARESAPVVPTREVVAEPVAVIEAIVEDPTSKLHSTSAGIPHATPISATAQTGGFTEPTEITAVPVAIVAGAEVIPAPAPPVELLTTQVPGHKLKTVPDLSKPSATDNLASHNPFNPEHTPGFLDAQSRTMTGGTTPGNELPGGWGGTSSFPTIPNSTDAFVLQPFSRAKALPRNQTPTPRSRKTSPRRYTKSAAARSRSSPNPSSNGSRTTISRARRPGRACSCPVPPR